MRARSVNYQGTMRLERKYIMDHYEKHRSNHMPQYLKETVNGKLVVNLRDISHTMRSLYEGRGSQKRVLIVLSEAGTITQRELTQRLGIQPGSASEVIAKLEQAELVARSLSETDRRTADISLTEEGRRQAQAALEQRQQRHKEMFSALTSEEKEQLLSLLEKINGDWESRYHERRGHEGRPGHEHRRDGHLGGHVHGGDWISGHDHSCDHDCEHCTHPCGRSRNR